MPEGLEIAFVENGSIAEEMEIEPGDKILKIDGSSIRDIIDFQYATAEESFILLLEKGNGEIWELDIDRYPGESIGVGFKKIGIDGLKVCRNNCVFCFVSQMPKGMRQSLYDKDDDYRLSITQGSFITLSNLSEEELERIVSLHLGPLYISVHAWNPEVRISLTRNPKAGDLPSQIEKLANAGIPMHVQVVLVPGYNDGLILKETIVELSKFYPHIQSIGVVPVGLTKFRYQLEKLRPLNRDEAITILEDGELLQEKFLKEHGIRLVYFSDELYVLAGKEFPPVSAYDGFPQLENGIGMASKFSSEVTDVINKLPRKITPRTIHLITGTSAELFFDRWCRLLSKIDGLTIKLHIVRNHFFGETVTVAGLLTAQDIASQVGDLDGELFLIPRVMLKADEDVFLDDYSIQWLEQKLNGKVIIVENNGYAFITGLLGMDKEVL